MHRLHINKINTTPVSGGITVYGVIGHAFAEMAAGRRNPSDFSAFQIHRFGRLNDIGEY